MILIDPVAFTIGPFSIYWYGLIIGIAISVGIVLAFQECKRRGIDPEFVLDFIITGIPVAIILARLYYVIFNWELYRGNIGDIIATWHGGLAIHGAILGGFLVLIYLSRKRGISIWLAADIMAPSLILGQAIGRWGNFINQEAHGGIVSREFISHFPVFIQKQMFIDGHYYHPTFLYESIWDILIFLLLIFIRRKNFIKTGDIFLIYAGGYSLGRFFIENMRTDSLMFGPYQVARIVSIIILVISIIILVWNHRKSIKV